jgi:hypothetical protein
MTKKTFVPPVFMNKKLILRNTQIAIGLLGSTIPNRYGNGKVQHRHRTYVTETVTKLLEIILAEVEESDELIVTKNFQNINPPEES